MKLINKHIVITGGGSGLGLALVRELYQHNQISVVSRPSTKLDNLRVQFPGITVYEADLADIHSVETAADKLLRACDSVDVLINNAAVQYTPWLTDDAFRYESMRREIDVNFTSICALTYLLLPALLESPQSLVLNINSGLSLAPKASSAIYCATKGALNIFSQSLAYQLEETGVDVRQAFLPLVDTPMTQGRGKGKLTVEQAAAAIIRGVHSTKRSDINVGKVKALRVIQRISPKLAKRIMKAA